jgi:hypothetical protein
MQEVASPNGTSRAWPATGRQWTQGQRPEPAPMLPLLAGVPAAPQQRKLDCRARKTVEVVAGESRARSGPSIGRTAHVAIEAVIAEWCRINGASLAFGSASHDGWEMQLPPTCNPGLGAGHGPPDSAAATTVCRINQCAVSSMPWRWRLLFSSTIQGPSHLRETGTIFDVAKSGIGTTATWGQQAEKAA